MTKIEWPLRSLAIKVLSHPAWSHFIPFIPNGTSSWYAYGECGGASVHAGLPVPPREFYADLCGSEKEFLESGKAHVDALAKVVSAHTSSELLNVLDFGCGAGRMTRWFKECLSCKHVYGTDIDSRRASWCANFLMEYGRFWTCTTHPHLPIVDHFFDLVVCGSIFTHIDDLSEAWLMEMARVTRKGGLFYVSIHDEFAVRWLMEHQPEAWLLKKVRSHASARAHVDPDRMPKKLAIGRFNRSQVFYRRDFFIRSIQTDFEHVATIEQGYGFQTTLLFRRR